MFQWKQNQKQSENQDDNQSQSQDRKQSLKKLGGAQRRDMILAVIIIIVVILFNYSRQTEPVLFEFEDNGLTLTGPSDAPFSVEIAYDDVLSISETDELDVGTNLTGICTNDCWFGTWQNDAYGEYTLCAYPKVSDYIVFETTDGIVACNFESVDATQNLYTALRDMLAERQQEG